MPGGRITQEAVNALMPGAKDIFYWDDKLPGFGLKVTPTGSKVYLLQYRMGGRGHKTKRYTIGKEGAFRAISARKEAERLSVLIRQGVDVAAETRKRKRVAVELAFNSYIEDFAQRVLEPRWPKSWKLTKARLVNQAAAHLGDKPLSDITAEDVRGLLRRLDKQPAARRNLFTALSFLFNQSVKDGVIAASPLRSIEAPPTVADRTRVLTDDEMRWLWAAVQSEAQPYRGVVEDLMFTAQRRNEVAGMPWQELDRDRREWLLPAKRAKNGFANVIPLTDNMVARLDAIAGRKAWPSLGLVRRSREGTVLSGWSKMKRRLDISMERAAKKAGAELEPWRLHDLRRTVATHMQRLGIQHEAVEHLLNHREKARTGIAAVYQIHGFGPEKRSALERWEAELARIVSGEEGKVVAPARSA